MIPTDCASSFSQEGFWKKMKKTFEMQDVHSTDRPYHLDNMPVHRVLVAAVVGIRAAHMTVSVIPAMAILYTSPSKTFDQKGR